jgi:hypothetical protein
VVGDAMDRLAVTAAVSTHGEPHRRGRGRPDTEHGVSWQRRSTDQVIHGDGCLLTPAFVDAHVQATAARLAIPGLNLHLSLTLAAALVSLRSELEMAGHGTVLGTGWHETGWPEQRGPSRYDTDAVAGEHPVHPALAEPSPAPGGRRSRRPGPALRATADGLSRVLADRVRPGFRRLVVDSVPAGDRS